MEMKIQSLTEQEENKMKELLEKLSQPLSKDDVELKKCSSCLSYKYKNMFRYRKNRGQYVSSCKECEKEYAWNRRRTKEGLITTIYNHQRESSIKRLHNVPTYTLHELKEWLFSQKKFHVLFDNWKRLDFQKEYVPSVDRIDDNIGYTMANIQLLTFSENNRKPKTKRSFVSAVLQYSKEGTLIAEFVSQADAERCTGINQQNISNVTKGKRKYAGGFRWETV